MKDLLCSLAFGTNLVLIVVATFFILWLLKLDNWMWISCAVIVGLVVGIIIGRSTEYYTSQSYRPTQKLSESGKLGPATVIISGISFGYAVYCDSCDCCGSRSLFASLSLCIRVRFQ